MVMLRVVRYFPMASRFAGEDRPGIHLRPTLALTKVALLWHYRGTKEDNGQPGRTGKVEIQMPPLDKRMCVGQMRGSMDQKSSVRLMK